MLAFDSRRRLVAEALGTAMGPLQQIFERLLRLAARLLQVVLMREFDLAVGFAVDGAGSIIAATAGRHRMVEMALRGLVVEPLSRACGAASSDYGVS